MTHIKITHSTIIAGSRTITNLDFIKSAMVEAEAHFLTKAVISGTAPGVDQLGEVWAGINNLPVFRFPADWKTWGRSAGYRRNEEMAEVAQNLVAIWDGVSKGTGHMIEIARRSGLRVYVHYIEKKQEKATT